MSTSATSDFSKIRSFLWPIHRHELKSFVPMLLIFFLVGFNYSLLRLMKDSLVVPASGAEALPFLKVWAIVPLAFLFTYIFTRVANRTSREKLFYIMMSIFLGFFLLFMFVLYPFQNSLHPNTACDRIQEMLPIGCRGFIAIFRNWTYTLFYVMSEMWSTIIMTVLAWGFANDVTSVKDAKRFYAILGISINFSGIIAGQVVASLSQISFNPNLPFGNSSWDQSVFLFNGVVIIAGILCMGLFKYMHMRGFGYNSQMYHASQEDEPKVKMGMRKNFAYLAKSKYLICIALIVIMYNIAMNLVEVLWKDQMNQLYPLAADFNAYMGRVLTATAIVATISSIFIAGTGLIRRVSWTTSAIISPLILAVTGAAFFFCFFLKDASLGAFLSMSPLSMCVFFGSLQNCLARASKYTLFDATKEIAFVPLSKECKLKGKAAIDGVGSRLGKSGGSVIHQGLLMFLGTVSLSTPYVAAILLFVIGAWMFAVKSLGRQFNDLTSHHETLADPDTTPAPARS